MLTSRVIWTLTTPSLAGGLLTTAHWDFSPQTNRRQFVGVAVDWLVLVFSRFFSNGKNPMKLTASHSGRLQQC
jgi:hypothetical protein